MIKCRNTFITCITVFWSQTLLIITRSTVSQLNINPSRFLVTLLSRKRYLYLEVRMSNLSLVCESSWSLLRWLLNISRFRENLLSFWSLTNCLFMVPLNLLVLAILSWIWILKVQTFIYICNHFFYTTSSAWNC